MPRPLAFPLIAAMAWYSPLAAQDGGSGASDEPRIVVTGIRLEDSLKALEECLARGCPPEEDIRLSLAHAENQFLTGDYNRGQRTLRGSIGRTRDSRASLPVPISGLYRASARLAQHQGEARNFQTATLEARDVLEKGLGADDWRTLVADVEVGDSRAKLGYPDEAERIYKRIETRALGLGQNRVASFVRLRLALLDYARWQDDETLTKRRDAALKRLDEMTSAPLPGGQEFALAARVYRSKIDREMGVEGSTEALMQAFVEAGGANRPLLIYSEPLQVTAAHAEAFAKGSEPVASNATSTSRLTAASFAKTYWADIGFFIGSDGQVSDVEILRNQGGTGWLDHVKTNIATRRYAPMAQDDARPGFYQIERYTLTAHFADETTGTRVRKREPIVRIERMDITPENYAANTPG